MIEAPQNNVASVALEHGGTENKKSSEEDVFM